MPQTFTKDPEAILDYQINWDANGWLSNVSDTIATSTWTVPPGITKVSDSNTTTRATIWLSGGTAGVEYSLVNHIVTAGGREDDRTITINVENK